MDATTNVILTGAAVLLGGAITYFVSKTFYVKAAKELNLATADFNRKAAILAHVIEGHAPQFSEKDELAGYVITVTTIRPDSAHIGLTADNIDLQIPKK